MALSAILYVTIFPVVFFGIAAIYCAQGRVGVR
jgi:hypothetical protein